MWQPGRWSRRGLRAGGYRLAAADILDFRADESTHVARHHDRCVLAAAISAVMEFRTGPGTRSEFEHVPAPGAFSFWSPM